MKDPKIDLDIDDNTNATLMLTCGDCNRKSKIQINKIYQGNKVKCTCGSEFSFAGDDLRKLQQQLDSVKRFVNEYGK